MLRSAAISLLRPFRRFARAKDGAVLVEFALILPLMLLFLGVTLEAGRMLWTYQKTISGVRDASRYFGRAVEFDICDLTPAQVTSAWAGLLEGIVENDIAGNDLFPGGAGIDVTSVTVSVNCIDDDGDGAPDDFVADTAIVGTVTANVSITFPAGSLLGFFGARWSGLTTQVTNDVRIYGQ